MIEGLHWRLTKFLLLHRQSSSATTSICRRTTTASPYCWPPTTYHSQSTTNNISFTIKVLQKFRAWIGKKRVDMSASGDQRLGHQLPIISPAIYVSHHQQLQCTKQTKQNKSDVILDLMFKFRETMTL